MNQAKESSVLFSLRELMALEEARIDDERAAARRRMELAAEAAEALERRAHDEDEARRRDDEDRLRAAEAETHEAEVRLAAIREAEVERVRWEVAATLRVEELRAQHDHERVCATLRSDRHAKRLTLATSVLALLLVGAVAVAGFYIQRLASENASLQERDRQVALAQKAKLEGLTDALRTEQEARVLLEQATHDGTEGHERTPETPHPLAPATRVPAPVTKGPARPPASACTNAWDPICTQLP